MCVCVCVRPLSLALVSCGLKISVGSVAATDDVASLLLSLRADVRNYQRDMKACVQEAILPC